MQASGHEPTQPAPALDALLRASAAGDAEAWRQLYVAQREPVRHIARRILGASRAEDACHDVFLRIHAQSHRFVAAADAAQHAQAWIRRMAINVCLNLQRAERTRRSCPLPEPSQIPAASAVAASEPPASCVQVQAALARLPAAQRHVLTLRYWHGLEYDRIAQALGCSAGAARVRVHRAMARLRARLGPHPLLLVLRALRPRLTGPRHAGRTAAAAQRIAPHPPQPASTRRATAARAWRAGAAAVLAAMLVLLALPALPAAAWRLGSRTATTCSATAGTWAMTSAARHGPPTALAAAPGAAARGDAGGARAPAMPGMGAAPQVAFTLIQPVRGPAQLSLRPVPPSAAATTGPGSTGAFLPVPGVRSTPSPGDDGVLLGGNLVLSHHGGMEADADGQPVLGLHVRIAAVPAPAPVF